MSVQYLRVVGRSECHKKTPDSTRGIEGFPTYILMRLIVLLHRLEVGLRMCTCRASYRGLLTLDHETTVAALPQDRLILLEYLAVLHILQQLAVALLMLSLHLSDHAPNYCDCLEALLLSDVSELGIKICPLLVLTISGCSQVSLRSCLPCQRGKRL